jgi:hypothetical protein
MAYTYHRRIYKLGNEVFSFFGAEQSHLESMFCHHARSLADAKFLLQDIVEIPHGPLSCHFMLGILLLLPQISDGVSRGDKPPSEKIDKLPLLHPKNHQVWTKMPQNETYFC